ncbi:hypothetical protein [Compostimonas suwonensis]|uniref:Uncharacterized protein n=1 Tax=Compostimonas suwonensis TaxID=1048394 RepID=A0A2M9BZE0_9MICO|nr:hypothetical protein [Compostimonas suwonensis]PJJ63440.1 hypothetical protein CLV54_1106 [Compostimonas suwonensis]
MSFVTAVLAESEHAVQLPMDPIWYGVIAAVIFAALGFVTWTYRNVANRHSHKAEAHAAEHAEPAGAETHSAGHPHH